MPDKKLQVMILKVLTGLEKRGRTPWKFNKAIENIKKNQS